MILGIRPYDLYLNVVIDFKKTHWEIYDENRSVGYSKFIVDVDDIEAIISFAKLISIKFISSDILYGDSYCLLDTDTDQKNAIHCLRSFLITCSNIDFNTKTTFSKDDMYLRVRTGHYILYIYAFFNTERYKFKNKNGLLAYTTLVNYFYNTPNDEIIVYVKGVEKKRFSIKTKRDMIFYISMLIEELQPFQKQEILQYQCQELPKEIIEHILYYRGSVTLCVTLGLGRLAKRIQNTKEPLTVQLLGLKLTYDSPKWILRHRECDNPLIFYDRKQLIKVLHGRLVDKHTKEQAFKFYKLDWIFF